MVESNNCAEQETNVYRSQILLLGGSSFMGLTLLKQLALMQDKFLVTMVNRGKTYWDRESAKIV